MINSTVFDVVVVAAAVIVLLSVVANVQQDIAEQQDEFCDGLFGSGGWVLNETTGHGPCKGYIGQCWECINKTHMELY